MTRIHFGYAAIRYAKPTPIVDAAWDADDIAGVAETYDPGSGAVATGYYTFATTPGHTYGIYEQVGATPSASDPLVYIIDDSEADAAAAKNAAETAATEVEKIPRAGAGTFTHTNADDGTKTANVQITSGS